MPFTADPPPTRAPARTERVVLPRPGMGREVRL
jgi:hypothetical protein